MVAISYTHSWPKPIFITIIFDFNARDEEQLGTCSDHSVSIFSTGRSSFAYLTILPRTANCVFGAALLAKESVCRPTDNKVFNRKLLLTYWSWHGQWSTRAIVGNFNWIVQRSRVPSGKSIVWLSLQGLVFIIIYPFLMHTLGKKNQVLEWAVDFSLWRILFVVCCLWKWTWELFSCTVDCWWKTITLFSSGFGVIGIFYKYDLTFLKCRLSWTVIFFVCDILSWLPVSAPACIIWPGP